MLFFGMGLQGQDQGVVLRGVVVDSASGQVLEEATVSLFKLQKPELVGRRKSNKAFVFENLGTGDYVLVTSYRGYKVDSVAFSVQFTRVL
jgi:hypothetical protein